jgi:hypothetical protein
MSLAEDTNTGGVCDAMAARFASADAARRVELEQLIRAGKGNQDPTPRKPRMVVREAEMPKKTPKPKPTPRGPCKECGSPTCHKRTCSLRPGGPAHPAPKLREVGRPRKGLEVVVPAALLASTMSRVEGGTLFDTKQATVEQLVETIEACKAELVLRCSTLKSQLDKVAKAIGSAA